MKIQITESIKVAQINENQISQETKAFIEANAEASYVDADESIGESLYSVDQLIGYLITEAIGMEEKKIEKELNALYDAVHDYQYFLFLKC